jgi:hypothetical protein
MQLENNSLYIDSIHKKELNVLKKSHWLSIKSFIWKEIGGLYPLLDIPSGFCFLFGSIFFSLVPLLDLINVRLSRFILDWILMIGVIFFTFAKLFVETRAIYAHFFKDKKSHVGPTYHIGVLGLFTGGMFFGSSLIVNMNNGSEILLSILKTISSTLFVIGSLSFVTNAFPHAIKDKFKEKTSNAYMLGSFFFLNGSIFFLIGSITSFPNFKVNDTVLNILGLISGLLFLIGASCYLVLGFWEMHIFKAGPDECYLSQLQEMKEKKLDHLNQSTL